MKKKSSKLDSARDEFVRVTALMNLALHRLDQQITRRLKLGGGDVEAGGKKLTSKQLASESKLDKVVAAYQRQLKSLERKIRSLEKRSPKHGK